MPKPKLVEPEEKTGIDWANIKTLDDVAQLPDEVMFDCTPDDFGESIYDVEINPDIVSMFETAEEAKESLTQKLHRKPTIEEIAEFLNWSEWDTWCAFWKYQDAQKWAPLTRGIIMIHGREGGGKSLLMNILGFKFREYYGKMPLPDSRPKPPFGPNIPFSREFFIHQIERINSMVEDGSSALYTQDTSKRWISPKGEVFIKWATFLLDEFSNDMHRMEQSKPIARLWGRVFKLWRHLECCIICCDADKRSIDPNYAMPRVTCEIKARAHSTPNRFIYDVTPLQFNTATQTLHMAGDMWHFYIDGNQPHESLNGLRPYDIYSTKNPQRVDIPKSLLKEVKL